MPFRGCMWCVLQPLIWRKGPPAPPSCAGHVTPLPLCTPGRGPSQMGTLCLRINTIYLILLLAFTTKRIQIGMFVFPVELDILFPLLLRDVFFFLLKEQHYGTLVPQTCQVLCCLKPFALTADTHRDTPLLSSGFFLNFPHRRGLWTSYTTSEPPQTPFFLFCLFFFMFLHIIT